MSVFRKVSLGENTGSVHESLVLIAPVISQGPEQPAHPRSLVRALVACLHNIWVG